MQTASHHSQDLFHSLGRVQPTDSRPLPLFFPPRRFLPSSLTAIRGKNNHIDSADRSGQESGNMNSHTCQKAEDGEEVKEEEEEEEGTDISVCLIVALIL